MNSFDCQAESCSGSLSTLHVSYHLASAVYSLVPYNYRRPYKDEGTISTKQELDGARELLPFLTFSTLVATYPKIGLPAENRTLSFGLTDRHLTPSGRANKLAVTLGFEPRYYG